MRGRQTDIEFPSTASQPKCSTNFGAGLGRKLSPGLPDSWQRLNHLNHQPAASQWGRKLESGVEPGHEPRHSHMWCRYPTRLSPCSSFIRFSVVLLRSVTLTAWDAHIPYHRASRSVLPIQFTTNIHWRQQMVIGVLGFLKPMWGTWREFLAPTLNLALPRQLQVFGEWKISFSLTLSMPLPLSHSAFQIHQLIIFKKKCGTSLSDYKFIITDQYISLINSKDELNNTWKTKLRNTLIKTLKKF